MYAVWPKVLFELVCSKFNVSLFGVRLFSKMLFGLGLVFFVMRVPMMFSFRVLVYSVLVVVGFLYLFVIIYRLRFEIRELFSGFFVDLSPAVIPVLICYEMFGYFLVRPIATLIRPCANLFISFYLFSFGHWIINYGFFCWLLLFYSVVLYELFVSWLQWSIVRDMLHTALEL